jgi:hemin uptake protein HemP
MKPDMTANVPTPIRNLKEPSATPARDGTPRRINISDILKNDREIIICHGGDDYRLRLTSNNKLLLTK